jgi:hypothetical protein
MATMTEPRSPVDQALDLFVFAPLGLALAVREELPRLIEKGRSRTDPQVALARMVGQLAVGTGQQEARKALNQLWSRLGPGPAGCGAAGRLPPPVARPALGPVAGTAGPNS